MPTSQAKKINSLTWSNIYMTKSQTHLTIFSKKTTSRRKKTLDKAHNTCCSSQMKIEHYSQSTKCWPCTWLTSQTWSNSINLSSHLPWLTQLTLSLARKKHLLESNSMRGTIISSTWQHAASSSSTEDALTTQSASHSKTSLWAMNLINHRISPTPTMKKGNQTAFHSCAMSFSMTIFHLSATFLTLRQPSDLHNTWSYG